MLPLTLFAKSAAIGCCSTDATIKSERFCLITCSSTFCIFLIFGIGEDTISTYGLSKTALPLSLSVIKCGDLRPHSSCTPSTKSTYVFSVSDSSISTTPSLPTFSNASPIILPSSASLLQLIVATWVSIVSFTGTDALSMYLITLSVAAPMPALSERISVSPLSNSLLALLSSQ